MSIERVALTVKEAAAMLGVHREHLYRLINGDDPDKSPPFTRVGTIIRIPRDEFTAWMSRRR